MALPNHPRTLVRDIVYEVIKQDPTMLADYQNESGGLTIFKHRARKIFSYELPTIGVYTLGESLERNQDDLEYKRSITVEVQLMDKDAEVSDEFLDQSSRRIEELLLRWKSVILDPDTLEMTGPISDFSLVGVEQGLFANGDENFAGLKMKFIAVIYDDDVVKSENKFDYSLPPFTVENPLVDLDLIETEIETTENAEVDISIDLTE